MARKKIRNQLIPPSVVGEETDILEPMPKKLPVIGVNASLWEQWLQKLSVNSWLSPIAERQKLAVIDWILTHYQPNRQMVVRLADRLTVSLAAQTAIVYQKNDDKVGLIHSRLTKEVTEELLSDSALQQLLLNFKSTVTQEKVDITVSTKDGESQITSLVLIPLSIGDTTAVIAIFLTEPLHRNDSKFIRLAQKVVKSQQHQQYLIGALSSESERLTTLIHHLSEGMVILDKDLRIVQWNRPMQRFTGYSSREAEKKPYQRVFLRSTAPDWLQELMTEYQTVPLRNVFFADFEIKTKQRRSCWVSVSGSFLRGADNQIEQTIIIVRDISRHKQLEQRKNEFISIATHELRTPITAIKGYLSLIERNTTGLSSKHISYVNRAREANDRLVRLAEDLLQVIQVEENRLRFSLRPVNLLPIARKVVADFAPYAKKKNLQLTITTPDFPTTVAVDPIRIEQVIANLVDNAIKYTQEGEVEVSFSRGINNDMREAQTLLSIRDTGIGIPQKELPQIFDKFHRCTNVGPNPQSGAGLGLFIVRSFVEKQHGQINVKSRPGKGTTFTLTFASVESNAVSKQRSHKAPKPIIK